MSNAREKQFLKKLLETFLAEAVEHITTIAAKLTELQRAEADAQAPLIEVAFREAHSLKAAARAVNRSDIEGVCQSMESVLAELKHGALQPSAKLFEALHAANDRLADMLASNGKNADQSMRTEELLLALDAARGVNVPAAGKEHVADRPAAGLPIPHAVDSIRVPVKRLDALLLEVEDLLSLKLEAQRQAAAADAALNAFTHWQRKSRTPRVAPEGVPFRAEVSRQAVTRRKSSEIDDPIGKMLHSLARSAAAASRATSLRINGLQESLKQTLMLDARRMLESLPKAVRDLARDQGKDVDFVIEGGEIEIDRRILEDLRVPLLHLLRNAVDHGIEKPGERRLHGKPERASLNLSVKPRNGHKVEFTLTDDGGGVSLRGLAAAAVKAGVLAADRAAKVGEAELLSLMFHTGISTSPIITEVSGRGLGMAIVRERIEVLGGQISVETRAGQGTTFRVVVPLTRANVHGIPVRAAGQIFVLPTLGVERALRIPRAALRTVENRPALAVEGATVPLVPLAQVLEMPLIAQPPQDNVLAVVLGTEVNRVAFEVDEILGDQEVHVKPLGKCLERVRNVAGATVLADGQNAPVLNVHDLLKSAAAALCSAGVPDAPAAASPTDRQLRVLVVEDSITARRMLTNILEVAGCVVKATVDGVEAWGALKLGEFDIVVSDVEMPRMNGFDLTARIRADKRLSEMPVVLLTALATREDRERGVEVGANAYLLKGDFDQHRLLETLRRLA